MDNRYTIRQLAELSGLSAHTLRYYEKAGLLQGVAREQSGYRVYEDRDLAWVQLIVRLRNTGMPIERIKQLADLRMQGGGTADERKKLLLEHREHVSRQMQELQRSLAYIDRTARLYKTLEASDHAKSADVDASLTAYYAYRADFYERIYHRDDPVRQAELAAIEADMRRALDGRRVLELACGTGFWTAKATQAALHVTATDLTPETLAIARHKQLPPGKVTFLVADAYRTDDVPGTYDAALANFWFSHVPKARIDAFLHGLHRRLGAGSVVIMADNMPVPGIGGELIARPGDEDTYKLRELPDGSRHEVLKNYYTERELRHILEPVSSELSITMGSCFWWVQYMVAGNSGR